MAVIAAWAVSVLTSVQYPFSSSRTIATFSSFTSSTSTCRQNRHTKSSAFVEFRMPHIPSIRAIYANILTDITYIFEHILGQNAKRKIMLDSEFHFKIVQISFYTVCSCVVFFVKTGCRSKKGESSPTTLLIDETWHLSTIQLPSFFFVWCMTALRNHRKNAYSAPPSAQGWNTRATKRKKKVISVQSE